ncbi:MAG: fused signal recognition particle receptor, partial [Rhodospirillaceae bacterium]|nr:fused signal recognition particle receptor [Rhodospirillaceae bacterium]
MSETPKPEEGNVEKEAPKKGWLSRWRSRGDSPSGTPEPEPASGTPEPEAAAETLEPEEAGARPEGEVETEADKKGWLSRLRSGLAKSTKKVAESITGLFTKKKLDQQTLDELEDALIQADLGVTVAARLVGKLGKERFGKEVTDEEVRAAFADDIAEILQPVATPLAIDRARKPFVVLVIGVNGSGKTTTIAKLANLYKG